VSLEAAMSKVLRVLVLEDRPADAELMIHELRRAGFEPDWIRVESEQEYLDQPLASYDIVLADYNLPQFDALSALYRLQERQLDIPLIIVSGSISEGVAVECMKQGAADYLLKDRPERLGQAVRRALEEKQAREQRRLAEAALRESEARYRTISELTSDFAYSLEVCPDGSLAYEWLTEAFTRITGFALADLAAPGAWIRLIHPDDQALAAHRLHKLCSGQPDTGELQILTAAGETRILRDHARPVWDEAGARVVRIHGAAQDITEHKRAEGALRQLALYDSLTGLPNRALLHDRLRHTIESATRDLQPVALLLMDLDRFKDVNDTLGHHVGDELLRQVAERLRSALRSSDTIARLGGDEFAVLLPDTDASAASLAAARLSQSLERPFLLEGQNIHTAASIGISLYPEHGGDAETLLRRADVAMYSAKRGGRGYTVYSPDQDQHTPKRLGLVSELRRAIEEGQLVAHYQPRIDLRSRRVEGVEALLRWQHPEHGLMPPDEFITLAEQTGLIEPLSRWVLNSALRQHQAWRRVGIEMPVAVNLSMRNLHDLRLPSALATLLANWDAAARVLTLEITESMIMADQARATEVLARLREMGMHLSIDDFGTGHASLAHLAQLPVHELKIDRSFVMRMMQDEGNLEIVRSTIALAHKLGLRVVAEGVEDAATLEMLSTLGCDAAQGFYMSKPRSPEELASWLVTSGWGAAEPRDASAEKLALPSTSLQLLRRSA
jgi:diguanylate cyclase (GGDEF)-like protein/PAS domain S-box-containing protein